MVNYRIKNKRVKKNCRKEKQETVLNCPETTTLHDVHSVPTTKLDICLDDITMHEILAAIRKLKNNKAAGIDNILIEYMKHVGEIMVMALTTICNNVWKSEEVPEDWKNGIIQPLPKRVTLRSAQTGGAYLCSLCLER